MANNLMVFSGNANPALADAIAKNIGVPLGYASISKFSDGEVSVELNENVRGKDVFVVQGERRNLKITTPDDFLIAEAWIED